MGLVDQYAWMFGLLISPIVSMRASIVLISWTVAGVQEDKWEYVG